MVYCPQLTTQKRELWFGAADLRTMDRRNTAQITSIIRTSNAFHLFAA
jgi:hypothetical protein